MSCNPFSLLISSIEIHINTVIKSQNIAISVKQTNAVAFSPQAKSTDWATANGRRISVPTFADTGVSRHQRGVPPTVVNLSVLDRSRYFSFKYLIYHDEAKWTS
jgi:hypothetical protein